MVHAEPIMMKSACLLLIATSVVVADEFTVALWGDLPYRGNSADVFSDADTYGPQYQALRDSMNRAKVDFALHTGDIKSGSTLCNDFYYTRFEDLSDSLNFPSLWTPGDNDWTDCHRTNNGPYNPLERLDYLRARFYDEDGESIMGSGQPIQTSSFGIEPYVENQYFVYENVMIALLHVVGSNNNLYDGSPGVFAPNDCTATLQAYDPGCVAATAEYVARDNAATQSLRQLFTMAKEKALPGILIMIQAEMFLDLPNAVCDAYGVTIENIPTKTSTGFYNFLETLLVETANYAGEVVLVNGDAHFFRDCNPTTLPNFRNVMVPGSADIGWVLATIDSSKSPIFNFAHYDSCTVQFSVFNAATDAYFGPIASNGTVVNPPCSVNIQATVSCSEGLVSNIVSLRLRNGSTGRVIRVRNEQIAPYFLFGDSGTNVFGGSIPAGTYTIEAYSAGVILPPRIPFTMGTCV